MKIGKDEKIILLGVGAVGLVYFGLLNPLLKFIGVKDSAETTALNNTATDVNSPWLPGYWKTVPGAMILTMSAAEKMATTLYDSFGWFNDNEDQAKAVIRSLKFKTQLSFLAQIFYQKYGLDLLSFLRGGMYPQDRLSDADVSELNTFINKLPTK
jgi:hypothetical protein